MMLMRVWRNLHVHLGRQRETQPVVVAVVAAVVVIIIHGLHFFSLCSSFPTSHLARDAWQVSLDARQLNHWETNKLIIL